jgi:hypothetical protein
MITKVAFFPNENEMGHTVVPLFHSKTEGYFEKVASPSLLPEVVKYIETLRPSNDACYNLVNALGAGEYFGANVNGDHFPEAALIHRPDEWTGNPLVDKIRSKDWAYGFPTFYYAHPYAHHRNKDATRAFGEVELAAWNNQMKRVELVTRVDKDKCHKFGGVAVWDKLKAGMYPDTSMGAKVPFDTCSICLDWKLYREAQATFDPKRHKSPGEAILQFHRTRKPIRGLSITRKDYCAHASKLMNKILPDGRKVFVFNDFPKFFDISFVFIGADKTSKSMMKIASVGWTPSIKYYPYEGLSADVAERLGYVSDDDVKIASAADEFIAEVFGKKAALKQGEIIKDVIPSQFAGKAVPVLAKHETDLPKDIQSVLGSGHLPSVLATTGAMGIVLRPREFQRIVLINVGERPLADKLDSYGCTFPSGRFSDAPSTLDSSMISPIIAKLLLPFMLQRSAIAPQIEHRVTRISATPVDGEATNNRTLDITSDEGDLLKKVGSAYYSYRNSLMDLLPHVQPLAGSLSGIDNALAKVASCDVEQVFSPLTVAYVKTAFMNEVGSGNIRSGLLVTTKRASADVQRGFPLKTT